MRLLPASETTRGPESRFHGEVYANMICVGEEPSRLVVGLVRFTPGAHTNWHSHELGQTLHVTEGVGLVGTRDGEVIVMRAGDTVHTPPGEEHWHGATQGRMMAHFAISEGTRQTDSTTWLEPVSEDTYAKADEHVAAIRS